MDRYSYRYAGGVIKLDLNAHRGHHAALDAGNVPLLKCAWNDPVQGKGWLFPNGPFDNEVDAAARVQPDAAILPRIWTDNPAPCDHVKLQTWGRHGVWTRGNGN